MEYTDAPPQPEIASFDTMRCPYCGTTLPANATACTNCDWTLEATKPAEPKASDAMAILLSIIPGLGHIYKGHYEAGLLWMFLGMPLAIWIGILLGLATAGIGLLFQILCWVELAWDAYNEKNRRHHHLTATWADDDESPD